MKKIILLLLIAGAGSGSLMAQHKKGNAHKNNTLQNTNTQNTQRKTMAQSSIKSFNVDGIRVLLKPTSNDVISCALFISGGVRNYTVKEQGIENLALQVLLDGGSKKYPKEKYHDLLEQKGIDINASSTYDYSTISMRATTKRWSDAWDIYRDVIVNPAWDEQSFKQTKEQTIAGLKQAESDPDNYLDNMAMNNTFKNTVYESQPGGTPESVNDLSLEQLKNHYNNIIRKKKMILVVVGKVNENELTQKVKEAFGTIQEGIADKLESNPVNVATPSFTGEEREIKTNYMMGILSAPKLGTRESIAMRIAMSILSERLFIEVRTKRNLSYAPSSYMSSVYNSYSAIYVSTTKPNDAAQVMMDEIRKIRTEGFKEKELKDKKEGFLTGYYMGMETNGAQANTIGIMELRGNYLLTETIKDEIYSLTLDDINSAMKKYATSVAWYYLGDKDKADESIFKAGL